MDALLLETRSILEEVHACFVKLERSDLENSVMIENEIHTLLNVILENCCQLDFLVKKVPPSCRTNARVQVDQLKYDCRHYRTSLQHSIQKRMTQEQECREREELLTKRFTVNNQNTAIEIDHSLQHHTNLKNATLGMDELLGTGTAVLSNLRDQRVSLKGAHRKILDIANTLGLSNTVMRLIEKRSVQDKYILFGGMLVVCVVMVLVFIYFA